MKEFSAAGGRVTTKFVAVVRWHTCGQETGCQINQRDEMRHLPRDFSGLGGRRTRG